MVSDMQNTPEIHHCPILVVEDNAVSRQFIENVLHERGMRNVLAVNSAEEALNCLEHFKPELVILDLMMPGMDGYECSRTIRSHPDYFDLPILIQTAVSVPQSRFKAFEYGATDFINKPIYPEELYARTKVHLQNRVYLKNLRHYKDRISDELTSAQQLQYSILPNANELTQLEKSCQTEIAAYFKPSSEIGGDFWGAKPLLASSMSLWMVDFSGHGVAAALNAFRLQAYLKEHIPLENQPGAYLSHLNEKMRKLLLRGQFATMFYGIVDSRHNRLSYSCACTPYPLLYNSASGRSELLDGTGIPLGVEHEQYPTQTIDFNPQDILVLYSDALVESGYGSNRSISEHMLLETLDRHHHKSASEIRDALIEMFNHQHYGMINDDLTLLVCKRK
jgi:sigma-B regulation protein RsbU (phosphoserine phosphatase)